MSNENFTDRELQCVDCGQTFIFTAEDQEFYANKGYSEPKRCPQCRQNRKNNGGGQRGHGGHGGGQRQQYEVTCAACGKITTVPFKPSNDRPVYCSECYNKQRGY